MRNNKPPTRPSLRRKEAGAVLVVVLLAMIALLGMGITGLYLTSGSIQMSSNINMRNQALYVAEAGIQTAKSVLNRTLAGNAASSASAGNGRYSRTWTTPTFSPAAVRVATVSTTVSPADPMTTITRSASGWPVYSTTW